MNVELLNTFFGRILELEKECSLQSILTAVKNALDGVTNAPQGRC
jgi:hypothetical protein